ncbi:MAG: ROK family protein [Chloroflexi bacterium]|nr:ROK family protein [Chloroflexota bacterium]
MNTNITTEAGLDRYAIGVDLGSTNVRVGLVRADGIIVASLQELAAGSDPFDFEPKVEQIAELVDRLLASWAAMDQRIDGIGLGVGGQINLDGEIVATNGPQDASWRPFAIRQRVLHHIGRGWTVVVDNDSKSAAWGEYLYGAGRGSQCMVCVTVGTGIGGGIVVDGRLLQGAQGLAGHVGFISVDQYGSRCPSGVPGCVEELASGTAIARNARAALCQGCHSLIRDLSQGDPRQVSSKIVFDAARQGDWLAARVLMDAGHALGMAICSLLHTLNPDIVVIGGGVAEQGDLFLEPVRRTVAENAMTRFRATPIAAARLGNMAGVAGAAARCWPLSLTVDTGAF